MAHAVDVDEHRHAVSVVDAAVPHYEVPGATVDHVFSVIEIKMAIGFGKDLLAFAGLIPEYQH
jgi:hypothetical protein